MSNIQLVQNLYILRKTYKKTQKDLADILNISRQAYSNYETGKRSPDLDLLIRFSQIYTISLDQLINQSCKASSSIAEGTGPYNQGIEVETGDTIYLTNQEVDVIKNYRTLSGESKMIVDKFLNYQDL